MSMEKKDKLYTEKDCAYTLIPVSKQNEVTKLATKKKLIFFFKLNNT